MGFPFFNKKLRIAIMVSGRGSNMEAILKAIKSGSLKSVKPVLVLSDNPDAKALPIARSYGVKAEYIQPGKFKTKLEGEAEESYIRALKNSRADIIVLAGFMRVIKPALIHTFENRIINIHPSLLPKYPGLHTHQRALEAGEKEAGCTVHFVSNVVDGGKRIIQAKVPVLPDDNEESLARKVLQKEHIILPLVISQIAEGKIRYENLTDEPVIYQPDRGGR